MHTVGTCRICETGPLGLRRCGSCDQLVILCNECDSAWTTANLRAKPAYADEETMPCPHCKESLWNNTSAWATSAEVSATDWIAKAIEAGELKLELKEDEAFGSEEPNKDDSLADDSNGV